MGLSCILFIACFLVRFFVTDQSIDLSNKKIKWISVKQSEMPLMYPEPVGLEKGHYFYLCRANVEGESFSGKLRLNKDSIRCLFPYNGAQGITGQFQMLSSPSGATSWIPLTGHVPGNAIIATVFGGKRNYVCRAAYKGMVIPGYLNADNLTCFFELDGEEKSAKSEIEILVINKFGHALGVTQQLS